MPKKTVITGYRVDVLAVETEVYETFYGGLVPCTAAMALSMAEHLKRAKAGGRIVEIPSEKVIEVWSRAYTPEPNTVRERVQALREAAGFANQK